MNKTLANELLELQEQAQKAKERLLENQGKIKQLTENLNEFGCENEKQAEGLLKNMENELQELEEHIQNSLEEVKEKYDFN